MFKALQEHFHFAEVLGAPWPAWYQPVGRILKGASLKLFDYRWSPPYSALAAKGVIARLREINPDVVFAVSISPLAQIAAREMPVVNIADATFHAMVDYYDGFVNSSPWARRGGEKIEGTLVRNALLSVYPSEWARQSAIKDYGVPPDRARAIASGANIEVKNAVARTLPPGEIRFLFVGMEWLRKGGSLALATIDELSRRGVPCRIDIVGCDADVAPPDLPHNVAFHGFVSKQQLQQLYADAHFLFVPSKAECYGIVYAEAACSGLPSIALATGGIPSVVLSGKTGILLPLDASHLQVADAIESVVKVPGRYEEISANAIEDSQQRLTWPTWGAAVRDAVLTGLAK